MGVKTGRVLSTGSSSHRPPILAVVGWSNSGKTTLIERLIPVLSAKGYKIATIKHDAHRIDIDTEGKDSWRHRKAGAQAVVLVSPNIVFHTEVVTTQPTLEEIRDRYLSGDVDLILAEGFKQAAVPKIEVNRKARSRDLISRLDDPLLIAVVSDQRLSPTCPVYPLDAILDIAHLIESRFLKTTDARPLAT